jgi:hypothetical protein
VARTVKQILRSYAERGVFRSFSQTAAANGIAEYRFFWLYNLPFRVVFDANRRALSFRNLLPCVARDSQSETELKDFIRSLANSDRLEHRRVDPSRLSIAYVNRESRVALTFLIAEADYEYGVTKAINVVNEVFLTFVNVRFPEYMIEQFKLPED